MHGSAASKTGRRQVSWLRKHELFVRLAVCFSAITLAAAFVSIFERSGTGSNLIWVANGLLLAYLLLAPRWRWPAYLGAGFLALVVGSALIGEPWRINLLLNVLDILEVLIAALLMRRRSTQLPRFTERAYLLRFVGFAVLAAPIAVALAFAGLAAPLLHLSPRLAFLKWAGADALGIAIVTPTCVAVFESDFRDRARWRHGAIYMLITIVVAIGAFAQNAVPLVFLLYPLLVLILLHVDLGRAALALLAIAALGSWFTIQGKGPFAAGGFAAPLGPSLPLQLFVVAGILILFTISVVMDRQSKTERRLQEIVSLHRLVTENSRDAIILADFSGRRSYVSAATESIGGWKPEELLAQSSIELVHPDDQHKAAAAVRNLREGAEGDIVEVRVRKRDGEYVWVEASLRVVRDPVTGLPSGILNTARDISERKRAEEQLREAYNTVEALALTDGLTGLANRRRFDQYLASEWRRGMRDHQPLSVLMIDADKFKAYNDTYGHTRGDSCLKQIAEAAMDVVGRPGDLVARFGGEEFVVVLPNTESEGAVQVANEICEALRSRRLPHSGNAAGIVTVSIGCATLVPRFGKHAPDVIEMADRALYKAKHNGRNQVCCANLLENGEQVLEESGSGKSA